MNVVLLRITYKIVLDILVLVLLYPGDYKGLVENTRVISLKISQGVALKFLIWEWGGINEGWHKVFKNGGGIKGVA